MVSLLNDKGTFCFITSNSWLDVGYGKDLQEFLLEYYHIKAIYDNQAKRSFEHADVNTISALFSAPCIENRLRRKSTWPALTETARFVMFKRPFEEVVNTKNLFSIEKADSVLATDAYRVYPIKQEILLEEGWEYSEDAEEEQKKNYRFSIGKYGGNKWGGKYLRAPDIFFTILEKGNRYKFFDYNGEGIIVEDITDSFSLISMKFSDIKDKIKNNPSLKSLKEIREAGHRIIKERDGDRYFLARQEKLRPLLVRLGDIAEVRRGFTTGCNEFFYLPGKHFDIRKEGKYYELIPKYEGLPKGIRIEEEYLPPAVLSPRDIDALNIKSSTIRKHLLLLNPKQ